MYPEYKIIQIVELPMNGRNKYGIRLLGHMEYFDFDFMCKNTLKKFFVDGGYDSGEYLIIRDNETNGDLYIVEAVCAYRAKESGNFVDFKLPGKEWKALVKEVMECPPMIDMSLQIQTTHNVRIPKIVMSSEETA